MKANAQQIFFNTCVNFWMREGIEKEDNLIALAMLDTFVVFKEKTEKEYKEPFYIDRAKNLHTELQKIGYNNETKFFGLGY